MYNGMLKKFVNSKACSAFRGSRKAGDRSNSGWGLKVRG